MDSDLRSLIHNLQSGADRRLWARLARATLLPLSWLYGAAVRCYRGLYDLGVLRTTCCPARVIAIGNLTVGGTGKSTTTRWLARMLDARGVRVAILSYGYHGEQVGGREEGDVTLVSDGRSIRVPVTQSGDEAWMLAWDLPSVPVLTARRRVLSAARAVDQFGAQVCLLDDGFQYWRLRKDLEIVLIDAQAPFGFGYLLPRGTLREPLQALKRAHVLLLMNAGRLGKEEHDALLARLKSLAPHALLCEGRHLPTALRRLLPHCAPAPEAREPSGPPPVPLEWLRGRRVAALSSLGNPENFERTLSELGVEGLVPRRFPDHYRYTPADLHAAIAVAPPLDAVITTAKDAPKLRYALAQAGAEPKEGPVFVLDVDLEITRGEAELSARVLGCVERAREAAFQNA